VSTTAPPGPERAEAANGTYWIRTRPNQKIGIDTPPTETAMMSLSEIFPRFTAAKVPNPTPRGTAQIRLATINSIVGPTVLANSLTTSVLEISERPRSPCSTRDR
jgi:hypothetical protein